MKLTKLDLSPSCLLPPSRLLCLVAAFIPAQQLSFCLLLPLPNASSACSSFWQAMSTSVIIPASTLDDRSIPPSQETTSYHQHTDNLHKDNTISSHADNPNTTEPTTHIPPTIEKNEDDHSSIASVKQERRESQVTIQELPNTTTGKPWHHHPLSPPSIPHPPNTFSTTR